ncbi:MAG: ATP-dependent RNA helicase HrpA [Duodenibacillus sp.]|nr:ATP-dependent RNA helicase HrpA [Duodenibacillus sp.]
MLSPESIRKEPGLPFGGKKKLAKLQGSAQGKTAPAESPKKKETALGQNRSKVAEKVSAARRKETTSVPAAKKASSSSAKPASVRGPRLQRSPAGEAPARRDAPEPQPSSEGEVHPAQKIVVRRNERGEIIRNPIPRLELMPGLPVSEHAEELIDAIRNNQVIIVCGETGSGKTTQLPKLCLMAGRGAKGLIGHTQPRRIAASSVAKRLAEELDSELGEVVGYKVRFTDETTPGASIKLMTDGILLAETQTDPMLRRYDTIIIDEAHERSINIDFLLGYLKRLLAKRRDLKVIVTSATIDAERFAAHFGRDPEHPAPVFKISGRTYPVEIRYRGLEDADEDDDRTLMDAIADAADELENAGRGDILVFLPGEREIREAAEVLRKRHRPGQVEILPLYARLSAQEQEKIFRSSGPRRIVLATNVAETSITVPGIRYVIDTGLARIKRYSYRNKVEQLLVEPISKASANQRAGRCGRVANGICIRLFDENDWARRPEFTDPEIVRSNLAAVILRMKALRLGDVREFPFVQAPPARAISDGYAILGELGALDDAGELTETGRQLSRLPIDPRLSRMLLAAHGAGALREALIIVSGLAIQDPRERPLEAQDAADRAHKIFQDEKSDFLSLLKIWNWYTDANAAKQSNRLLTEQLKARFLSPRRMREWRDVWRQLGELTRENGWSVNAAPATYEQLHRSLLTGLLGNIGMRQLDADLHAAPFAGARGIRFWVWPGSGIAKKAGKWIMSAELVQTSRLFARTAADIEPEWVEAEGAHLIKKSWAEPHWEKSRGEVVALERGSLYGLTIYSGRRVGYSRHDPALSRELFIKQALVAGDFDCRAPFFEHNMRLVREIREIEHKARRPDVLIDDDSIAEFYEKKIPCEVVGAVTFERWRKEAESRDPKLLFMKREELMRRDAEGVTVEFFPKKLEMAGVTMALSYHFEPGAARDGLTMAVPLFVLNQIDPVRCDWLVPGMLREKVQALIKSLPQRLRRHCVPIADYAMGFYRRVNGRAVPGKTLVDALIDDIREQTRAVCERTDFKQEFLPAHLTMNFKVIDEHGRQLAMGRNLAELRAELGGQAQELFASMAQSAPNAEVSETDRIVTWSFGELPELMEISRRGASLIGHPALVDRGEYCSLEVFDDPEQARRAHRAGLRRLFILQMREQVRYLEKNLSGLQRVQMQASVIAPIAGAFESFEGLRDEVVQAAIDLACMAEPWPTNAEQFAARKDEGRSRLTLVGMEIERLLESVTATLAPIPKKLAANKGFPEAVKDIEGQLRELFPKHFLLEIPSEQLRHYPRYAKALMTRLEKLRNDPARDEAARADIARLSIPYRRELASRRGVVDPRLAQFRWLLEELRVSLFAQELRTPMPVSVKRLTRVWESLRRL